MKRIFSVIMVVLMSAILFSCTKNSAEEKKVESQSASVPASSYASEPEKSEVSQIDQPNSPSSGAKALQDSLWDSSETSSVSEESIPEKSESNVSSKEEISSTSVPSSGEKKEDMVWVTDTGKKYHKSKSCSQMKNPYQIPISEAESKGYTPCKKCC